MAQKQKKIFILKGIGFAKTSNERFPIGVVLPIAVEIEKRLQSLPYVKRAIVAGSIRRRKETIGDADFLVVSEQPRKVMDYFVSMPDIARVYGRGETKSMIKLKNGLDADLRVVPERSLGAALNYFTGSK
ncbi:MAG: DNA polymerase III, partial [Candidatus Aenigmarchaeota archaeon]|nr:DNA polymerase III [Candidatus Aenigmarchaeota archaeon]